MNIGDRRVAICPHIGREVVQELVPDNVWLCLHNDTDEEDTVDVEKFRKEEELWDKIQALSQQVFWKEQQRVTDGIALGELKKVLQEYGMVK